MQLFDSKNLEVEVSLLLATLIDCGTAFQFTRDKLTLVDQLQRLTKTFLFGR